MTLRWRLDDEHNVLIVFSIALTSILAVTSPYFRSSQMAREEGRAAATALGLDLRIFEVRSLDEPEHSFEAMAKDGVQATILGSGSLLFQGKATIAKLAFAAHLPTCAWSKETLQAGALAAYGPDYLAIVRSTPSYVDKILKGARPTDLPAQQPTRFQLLINLKAAKALGLNIPPTLLARADEVIEWKWRLLRCTSREMALFSRPDVPPGGCFVVRVDRPWRPG